MNKIFSQLKYLIFLFLLLTTSFVLWESFLAWSLIIIPTFFLLIIIFISHQQNISIPLLSSVLRRQYFKIKFLINSLDKNKKGLTWFFCNLYSNFLRLLVLLFKSSEEGFELLRDDIQAIEKWSEGPSQENILKALKNLEERIKSGQDINKKDVSSLYKELLEIHREKKRKTTVFSMFSLVVILISTIIISLVLHFLFI